MAQPQVGLVAPYAGNPLAIAAAHAVIDVMEEAQLVARANVLGEKLTKQLKALQSKVPRR